MTTKNTVSTFLDTFFHFLTRKGQKAKYGKVSEFSFSSLYLATKKIKVSWYEGEYNYEGEIDENGMPCGLGYAFMTNSKSIMYGREVEGGEKSTKYIGTWFKGVPHGQGKINIYLFI